MSENQNHLDKYEVCVVSQHKLVVADFRFRICAYRGKQANIVRTKWWKLKGEALGVFKERVTTEGTWFKGEETNDIWMRMASCIRKVAAEVFGVTKRSKIEPKDIWWWNKEVQKAIKEKKECYKSLYQDRSSVNLERYKVAKKD